MVIAINVLNAAQPVAVLNPYQFSLLNKSPEVLPSGFYILGARGKIEFRIISALYDILFVHPDHFHLTDAGFELQVEAAGSFFPLIIIIVISPLVDIVN